jgi:hypothetical protein
MPSIRNPGGGLFGFPPGARVINYDAVVTREFPEWKVILTGGGIPEPGQTLTSLSYARLQGDVSDWLEWYEWGELNGWVRDPDQYDHEVEHADEDDGGAGWSVRYDCLWPHEVNDALERYWTARKRIDEAGGTTEEIIAAIGEPLCTICNVLRAGDSDVAAIVCRPVDDVAEILMTYRGREAFLREGLTFEDWQASYEHGGEH